METLKRIGNKLILIGQKIRKACSDMFQIGKLKRPINKEKRKRDQSYMIMGKMYFEQYGTTMKDDSFRSVADNIQQSLSKIEQLEGEIRFIKGIKMCPHCGTTCEHRFYFCPICGNAFAPELQTDNTVFPVNVANQYDTAEIPVVSEISEPGEEQEKPPAANDTEEPVVTTEPIVTAKKTRKSSKTK